MHVLDSEAKFRIQLHNSGRRLVGGYDGARVTGQPFSQANLVIPAEPLFGVLPELHIIGRVGIDETGRLELKLLEVSTIEAPLVEEGAVPVQVHLVVDVLILAEGNIELALSVETAQAVVARAVEIKEQLSRFSGIGLPLPNQLVETAAVGVVEIPVVTHFDGELQAFAYPTIEIDQVRVDVIQSGMFGQQPQGHGHAAAEGLHETAVFMSLVELLYDGHQPALAACPLEQRFKHRSPLTTRFAGTKGVWSDPALTPE